jgi:integrase
MFQPIKPICDPRTRKDGKNPISIQYCFSSEKRTVLATGISIPPGCWNDRFHKITSNLPAEYGDPENLNLSLQKMMRTVEDIVTYCKKLGKKDPVSFLREVFAPDFDASMLRAKVDQAGQDVIAKNQSPEFFDQIDDYIKSKSRKVSPGMLKSYATVKNRMLAYQAFSKQKITFSSFDFNFYEAFVNYLTYDHRHMHRKTVIKGLKKNSVGTSIKQLRIFLRDRARRKIIQPIDLTDFKILEEECDAIYLTMQEIGKIYELDLSKHQQLIKFRDLFVLGSLTGLRFSDFSGIKPEDIRGNMLYKKQSKSDHWVVIPLRPEAFDILVNRFRRSVPRTTNEELNRSIKRIGQLAKIDTPIKVSHKKGNQDVHTIKPKFEWITTHTCRRSFCTNEFLAGTPPDLIMKISGHKSVKDFYKYIRITPEEAGKRMEEIWKKRGEMGVV